jgi:hypothetical protein
VLCDVQHLPQSWSVNSEQGQFTDYALTRIVATGMSSYTEGCKWEEDGMCDVPNNCPAGTDTVDCSSEDTDELRTARTVDHSGLTREVLDGGSPRTIVPVPLFAGALEQGVPLTVIGHPSGLPRKYTGGGSVLGVAECGLETICPAVPGGAQWAAYTVDADTFGGNSGSGTFTDDGTMVGILISGATDYVYQASDYGGQDDARCKEVARCPQGVASTACRLYDTSMALPEACQADVRLDGCLEACEGTGLEQQSCGGENVASVADVIRFLHANIADSSTYTIIPPPCTTTGGNAPDGSTCVFPFTYNGVQYNECTSIDEPAPWCNVDADQEDGFSWGFCACGTNAQCAASVACLESQQQDQQGDSSGEKLDQDDDTSEPVPDAPPAPPPPLAVAMALPGDVTEITTDPAIQDAFENAFETDMATVLGIEKDRITVIGITAGSIIVAYEVAPAEDGTQMTADALETAVTTEPITFATIQASGSLPSSFTDGYAEPVTVESIAIDDSGGDDELHLSVKASVATRAQTLAVWLCPAQVAVAVLVASSL